MARRLAVLGLALVVAAVVIGLRMNAGGGPAEPVALMSAAPADGARLGTSPDQVSLTFSAEVDSGQTHVVVVDPDGTVWSTGEPVVRGGTVTQPVDAAGDGPLVVAYHAVFRDGRELAGRQQFVVGAAAGPGVPRDAAEDALAVAEAADGHDHGELGPLAAVATLVVMAGGAAVLILALRRPAR
jgi:methionine-rich copper-binding protein CopC